MSVPGPSEHRLRGILLRSASATAFAGMAALLKAVSERGVSAPEMIFYRNGWALLVVGSWIALGPGWTAIRTNKPAAHLTRSAIGLVSMLLTFGALALLPLGEATTLTYAAPLIATILSGLLLGEAIGRRRWAAVAVGFVGVALVAQPDGNNTPLIGVLIGIAAAFGQSAVMITVRQISRTEGTAAIVFWFSVFSMLAGAAMLPVFGHWHPPLVMAMLAGAGLLGGFAQIAMTASLRFAPVSVVVPFDYLQIVWATCVGWVAFGTPPTSLMLTGAALICASGLYTAYRESVRGREPTEARAMPEG
jgi:drug/metabolite transporter (DMT)-like permease